MLSYGYKNTVGVVAHLFFSDPPLTPYAIYMVIVYHHIGHVCGHSGGSSGMLQLYWKKRRLVFFICLGKGGVLLLLPSVIRSIKLSWSAPTTAAQH